MSRLVRVFSASNSAADPARGITGSSSFSDRWRSWETIESKGEPPSVRSGHAAVIDETGTYMYVFGGYHNNRCYADLYRLHLHTHTWSQVRTTGQSPVETTSHSAVIVHNKLVVFGGSGVPFGHSNSERLHVLDLEKLYWDIIDLEPTKWPNDKPTARYGHTMIAGPEGKLYLFGGTTGHVFNSELYVIDLEGYTSERIRPEKESPPPCYKHDAIIHDGKLYVIGGGTPNPIVGELISMYSFDFNTLRWDAIYPAENAAPDVDWPFSRRSHTCVAYDGVIYMCGGTDGARMFDDLWTYNIASREWKRISRDGFTSKYFHTAVVTTTGRMFVFGGCTDAEGKQRTNDVLSIWLGPFPSLVDICADAIMNMQLSVVSGGQQC